MDTGPREEAAAVGQARGGGGLVLGGGARDGEEEADVSEFSSARVVPASCSDEWKPQ